MKKFQSVGSQRPATGPRKVLGTCGATKVATEVEQFRRDSCSQGDGQAEVEVVRASFLPGILSTTSVAVRRKFRAVGGKRSRRADEVFQVASLGPKRVRGPGLVSKFLSGRDFTPGQLQPMMPDLSLLESDSDKGSDAEDEEKPPKYRPHEPLVLHEPSEAELAAGAETIEVPPILCQWLRPHQREGVQFVFECVYGLKDYGGCGAILADDMGLGKTLQSITLIYTLLKCRKEGGQPIAKRAVVVCPCSLVKNWQDEFEKWINSRTNIKSERVECMALADTSRKTVEGMIDQFLAPTNFYDVLVVSYETFRAQAARFARKKDSADLIVCDEAHRLKNEDAQTSQALASLACRKRVLLSGTPMQNDLVEFFAMTNFTNPGVFGTRENFTRHYEGPILRGREPDATDKAKKIGLERQRELSEIADQFIIRRMNRLNAQHLPPKLTQVVCCRLTPTQERMYSHVVSRRDRLAATEGHVKDTLGVIQRLQKICNHPMLATTVDGNASKAQRREAAELESLMPQDGGAAAAPRGRGGRVLASHSRLVDAQLSGKLRVLHALLKELRRKGRERIVVVSVYMTTLDLIEQMCNQEDWPTCKLGGSTSTKKRKQFNDEFNDPASGYFCFLLSSKAGGCGLNLIGGSRLVMFDLDWNPATDKQAAARCWRDGQRYQCYTYRFVSTGSLEERMLQRQLSKEGLQNVIEDKAQVNHFATDDLKKLFLFRPKTASDLHDELQCTACKGKHAARKDTSKTGGVNALSAPAAALCRERLGGLLAGDDAARALVSAPVKVDATGTGPHGVVEKKLWQDTKAYHMDLGTVLRKLDDGDYALIPDVLKDLRRIAKCAARLFAADAQHATRRAADALVAEVEALWEPLVGELYRANEAAAAEANEATAAAAAVPGAGWAEPEEEAAPFKKQLYPLPKEEDLNNWSHHASINTIEDEVLKTALRGRDDVSFVFGMYQDWELIQVDTAREKEEQAKEAALKEESRKCAAELAAAAAAEDDEEEVKPKKRKPKKLKKKAGDDAARDDGDASSRAAASSSAEASGDVDDAASAPVPSPADPAEAAPPARTPPSVVTDEPPRLPTPGAVLDVVWTKGETLTDPPQDKCVVLSITDPRADKKRKSDVPEHLAYHAYAELRSLIRLAGDQEQAYDRVSEDDPRPKHIHAKYKLHLNQHGTAWRVVTPGPGVGRPKTLDDASEARSCMSDLSNSQA